MSLIISQTSVNRLPAELVNNAAFVKQVDFDPVHETAETGQPAEKIHGDALPRFDKVSISAKEWMKDTPSGDGFPAVLDITDHAALETSQHRNELYSRLMKSWNSLMDQLKQESESGGFDYIKTIRLFRSRSAEWEKDLQQTDPEAYQVWLDKFKNVV